ncbi:hypothetical protein F4809DRAFT_603654 [Biscogniauxia mediterranea]|nr:hypothetical protein F4809DRAFT_603654 [Biscogniauxia mediterranea]
MRRAVRLGEGQNRFTQSSQQPPTLPYQTQEVVNGWAHHRTGRNNETTGNSDASDSFGVSVHNENVRDGGNVGVHGFAVIQSTSLLTTPCQPPSPPLPHHRRQHQVSFVPRFPTQSIQLLAEPPIPFNATYFHPPAQTPLPLFPLHPLFSPKPRTQLPSPSPLPSSWPFSQYSYQMSRIPPNQSLLGFGTAVPGPSQTANDTHGHPNSGVMGSGMGTASLLLGSYPDGVGESEAELEAARRRAACGEFGAVGDGRGG